MTGIVLLGAALRIAPLTDNRFHPDEALFGTLGRLIIEGKDPLLSQTRLLVDKPPLFYYMLASAISIDWASELTARLPGLFASIVSLALVVRLTRHLWRSEGAASVAGLLFALSPFAISFAPTAFADPQMVMWLLAAMLAICTGRWGWGGFFFGLALATKENAIFFAPLIIGLGFVQRITVETNRYDVAYGVLRFAFGIGVNVLAMGLWQFARHTDVGFLAAALGANNPHRIIRSNEVWPRLASWWGYLKYATGGPIVTAFSVALVGIFALIDSKSKSRPATTTLILIAFCVAYFAFMWLVAFPVLDRYLLPLIAIIAILLGKVAIRLDEPLMHLVQGKLRVVIRGAVHLLVLGAIVPSAFQAMSSELPVGGDHGAYDGIDQAAAYLRNLPPGTAIYYNSLGWELNYYLFDSYVVPAVFASPDALTTDLLTFGQAPNQRYLIMAGGISQTEIMDAVQRAGFEAQVVKETYNRAGERSFVIYHLATTP